MRRLAGRTSHARSTCPQPLVDSDAIVKEESSRCVQAVHGVLITASDAKFEQPQLVSSVLVASIVGPARAVIESGGDRRTFDALKLHLTALCVGYLKEVSTTALMARHGRTAYRASA